MTRALKYKPKVEPSEIDWARLSAFIDGEGSIAIDKQIRADCITPHYGLVIVIANTDPRLVLWGRERFGGKIYARSIRSAKHRMAYAWHLSSSQAEFVIRGCLPYMLLKREQAELALAFRETYKLESSLVRSGKSGRASVPVEVANRREELFKQIRAAKKEKFEAPPDSVFVQ